VTASPATGGETGANVNGRRYLATPLTAAINLRMAAMSATLAGCLPRPVTDSKHTARVVMNCGQCWHPQGAPQPRIAERHRESSSSFLRSPAPSPTLDTTATGRGLSRV
jgi:hypothetical protein